VASNIWGGVLPWKIRSSTGKARSASTTPPGRSAATTARAAARSRSSAWMAWCC